MSEFQYRSDLTVLLLEAELPAETRQASGVLRWTALWTILSFGPLSCAQQAGQGRYAPAPAEVVAVVECERMVLGEVGPGTWPTIRSGIYDFRYGVWGIVMGERTDEIIRCLVERHGWSELREPDWHRGAVRPPR